MRKRKKRNSRLFYEKKKLNLNSKLTFGKYKGKKISEILDFNREYIIWLNDNVEFVKLSKEVLVKSGCAIKYKKDDDPIAKKYVEGVGVIDDGPLTEIYLKYEAFLERKLKELEDRKNKGRFA